MDNDKTLVRSILLALLVAVIPHIFFLPFWVLIFCAISWGYVYLSLTYRLPQLHGMLKVFITIASVLGVVITYGPAQGGESSVSLLLIMAALKPFEIKGKRDRMVIIFITYFLIISGLFYSASLIMTLYLVVSVTIASAVLMQINQPDKNLLSFFGRASSIILQAIPIVIILFILFPRIQGSLWGFYRSSKGISAFSDSISPGDISSLARSKETAFRVQFEGEAPPPDKRYWRGLTLYAFDGRKWTRSFNERILDRVPFQGSNSIRYTIILEPHNQKWLFALDLPNVVPRGAEMTDSLTLRLRRFLKQRSRFEMSSYLDYNTGSLSSVHRGLQKLPSGVNPRAHTLARRWLFQERDEQGIINQALNFFSTQGFSYTLNPPLLGKNSVDDFLFISKKGYCEHFASAFAFLMRAANVPSRVVVGYQGGQKNPYADYYIVRQADAHAWVEVWIRKRGWVRIDPTSVVAPERITQGVEQAVQENERDIFSAFPLPEPLQKLVNTIMYRWDAVNTYWYQMIMGYTYEKQRGLLERLGIKGNDLKRIIYGIILLACLITLVTVILIMAIRFQNRVKPDPIIRYYETFCHSIARSGLYRKPSQGPLDFLWEIRKKLPELSETSEHIINFYIQFRYQERITPDDVEKFKKLIDEVKKNEKHSIQSL